MKLLFTLTLALFLPSAVIAQQAPGAVSDNVTAIPEMPPSDVSVGVGLSTLGANLEAAYRFNPTYGVRGVVMGGIDIDYDETDENGDFTGNLDLGGFAVMGDFYPLQSGWRVSGGLFISDTELRGAGTAEVATAMDIEAEIAAQFKSEVAPMVTTGYDFGLGESWSLTTEAGVIFTGGIDLTYTADDPALQDELDNDPDLQDAVETADDISVYPYASVIVSFRF